MIRCALYSRVSTKAARGLQNPENQLRPLREFASSQGWTISAELEFVDRESGAKSDRPEFGKMTQAASRKEFDVLLFWSLDRFSREGVLKTLQQLNALTHYGVKYRSLQESFVDTMHPFGDLLTAFVAKIAELERVRIKARIAAGLEKAKADGTVLGRPRVIVNRQRVWDLGDQGMTVRQIAGELSLSHGVAQRILQARSTSAGVRVG